MTQADEIRMLDAAFPSNIPPSWQGVVGGYLAARRALNAWLPSEWATFTERKKLPIWVNSGGGDTDGDACLAALQALQVPTGAWVAVDMETRVDSYYIDHFGAILANAGYDVWVYGSASTVFRNPPLRGYWVADYAGIGPFMYMHSLVRATQYEADATTDASTIKDYAYFDHAWWV